MDLREALLHERLDLYRKLRGGFPVPLAGAAYWGLIGVLGWYLDKGRWCFIAFLGTGAIFPLALLFAKLFRNNFMKEKSAVGTAIVPAFISMLLFWPMLIGAIQVDAELAPLILAIGMSGHWPVIGWTYARTALYSAHSIVRAVVVLLIWLKLPEARFTLLPLAVALIYLLTVVVIWVDSGRVKVQPRMA